MGGSGDGGGGEANLAVQRRPLALPSTPTDIVVARLLLAQLLNLSWESGSLSTVVFGCGAERSCLAYRESFLGARGGGRGRLFEVLELGLDVVGGD